MKTILICADIGGPSGAVSGRGTVCQNSSPKKMSLKQLYWLKIALPVGLDRDEEFVQLLRTDCIFWVYSAL